MTEFLQWIIIGLPSFILAGTVHEYMHAWTAKKLGDYTATMEGRLSLNPLVHLDPIGTLLMAFARFGWMRPVPVNEYNFKNRERDMAIVAAAGPLSNIVMAVVAAFLLRLLGLVDWGNNILIIPFLQTFFYIFVWVNIALFVFNLLPVPPLDGHRIVRAFLPRELRYYWTQLEQFAPIILLLILLPFSPLSSFTLTLLSSGVQFFLNILLN